MNRRSFLKIVSQGIAVGALAPLPSVAAEFVAPPEDRIWVQFWAQSTGEPIRFVQAVYSLKGVLLESQVDGVQSHHPSLDILDVWMEDGKVNSRWNALPSCVLFLFLRSVPS